MFETSWVDLISLTITVAEYHEFQCFCSYKFHNSSVPCLSRSPATSRIRSKMLYATSKERFRREMDGVHYEIQATDPTEMDLEVLKDRAN